MGKTHVTTTVNGDPAEFLCEPGDTLLDVLRNELKLTGTKEGCGSGDCGACSVTMDGRLVCSCLVLGVEAEGAKIGTVEGIAANDELHVIQEKFLEQILDFFQVPNKLFDWSRLPTKTAQTHYRKGQSNEWESVFSIRQKELAKNVIPHELAERFFWNANI